MEENQQPYDRHTISASPTKYFTLSHHKYRLLLILTIAVLGMFFLEAYELLQQGWYAPTPDTYKVSVGCTKILLNNRTESCNATKSCASNTRSSIASRLPLMHQDTISQVQAVRQAQLRNFCRRHVASAKKRRIAARNLLYSDRQGVVYCSVPKVACTNWKRVLQVFEGKMKHPMQIRSKQSIHKLKYLNIKSLRPPEQVWRRNVYYSFLFVRHPFERLLSAYRNKFLDTYNSVFQRRYGSRILKLFRPDLPPEDIKAGKNVTFKEFIDFVVHVYEKKGSGASFDEHWQLVHTLCTPCHMKYNYIGKMETLIEDANQVLKEIGVAETVKFPANATDKYKSDIRNLMKTYYSQLPQSTLLKLYKIYEDDFLSFDYKVPEYLAEKVSLL